MLTVSTCTFIYTLILIHAIPVKIAIKIMLVATVWILFFATEHGTELLIYISDFVQRHGDDIRITFESARNEYINMKYYMEIEVEFNRTSQDGDIQHTAARFYIPPTTLEVSDLDLPNIITSFLEKIDGFSGQNSGWNVSKIKYLRLCWGCYLPLVAGSFIPTPKFIASKKPIVNIQNFHHNNCFQYSVLAVNNVIKSGLCDQKHRPLTRTCIC